MITPQKAQELIAEHCNRLASERVSLDDALGYVIAEDVTAPLPLPSFDNSAMDGYALRMDDTTSATSRHPVALPVTHTVYAGDVRPQPLRSGTACGIMTGAPLPRGADTIVPIEDAHIADARLYISAPLTRARHVRARGEEIQKGDLVLRAGAEIHPGSIAVLASVGRGTVRVTRKPRVSVIATGDETVAPGQRLQRGQIFDCNSHMTRAMLRRMGIEPVSVRRVKDHRGALSRAVRAAIRSSDVVIVLGGVSVGTRDYLRSVLEELRVGKVFWRVAQKPGKPLYFGVRGKKLVFGLPGNPASVFTCFYVYVYSALRHMAGFADAALPAETLGAVEAVERDPTKWRFLKARAQYPSARVTALPGQGSHMITSLAEANSLMIVPPEGKPAGKRPASESGASDRNEAFRTLRLPFGPSAGTGPREEGDK